MAPQEKSVSQLPLISDCHVVSAKNPHSGETLVLTLHLRSLGGTVYQVPLSIRAAKAMLLALASWESRSDSMKQSDVAHPPRRH
jgi:hypothetical protein